MITTFKKFEKLKNSLISYSYKGYNIDIMNSYNKGYNFELYIDDELFVYINETGSLEPSKSWKIIFREDIENLDFLFDTKEFELDLSSRLSHCFYGDYDLFYGMVDRYGEKVSSILMKEINKMKEKITPMDGFGVISVGKKNDLEDYKRYKKSIANCCDGSSVRTINIDGDDFIIYIEYE